MFLWPYTYNQPKQIFAQPIVIRIARTGVDIVAMSRSPESQRRGDALLKTWKTLASKNLPKERRVPFGNQIGTNGVPVAVGISEIMNVARDIVRSEG